MRILHSISLFDCEDKRIASPQEKENDLNRQRMLRVLRSMMKEVLTGRQYQITKMYYIENLNIPKISQKLGINKSTVSKTIQCSLKKLMPYLKYYRLR